MAAKKGGLMTKLLENSWSRTLTPNQVLRLVMLKMNLMNLKRNNNNNNSQPQHQKTSRKLQQVVGDYQAGDRLKEGTLLSVLLLSQQEV
jgi:hypothetical protein